MEKLIKGLIAGIKKFFGGIYSVIIKAGAGFGGKKKDNTK